MRSFFAAVLALALVNCGSPELPSDAGNLDTALVDAGSDAAIDADTDINIDAKCVNTPARCAVDPECCADAGSNGIPDGHVLGDPIVIDVPRHQLPITDMITKD